MALVYDFTKITLIIDGMIVSGFGDGDAISREPNEDKVTYQEGADGVGEYTATNKQAETMTLQLQRTSGSNGLLNSLYKQNKKFSVQLIDHNDNSESWSAADCMIPRGSTYTAGSEATPREWTILIPKID